MMSMEKILFDEVLYHIQRGQLGLNKGLPHGYPRLESVIPDLQQSTYYLLGAEPSVGKTAYVDNTFLYNPFEYILNNPDTDFKLKIFYFSFEISKIRKIIKGVSRRVYLKHGIETDVNLILSKGKNRIGNDLYEIVKKERDYFDQLEDVLEIYDVAKHPTAINKILQDYYRANGKVIKDDKGQSKYIPNNPNEYVFAIIDHYGLTKSEMGLSKKALIDKLSGEYMVNLRNFYGLSPVMISQFNRDISSTDRFKLELVEPKSTDFKETGNTFEDCDICFALFNPYRHKLQEYRGYNILKLKNRMRGLSILKNRDGEADVVLGLKFVGSAGYFEELKLPTEMTNEDYINVWK